jgi:hypothetical protein
MYRCGGIAAAFVAAWVGTVSAGPALGGAAATGERFDHYLLFGGFDLWRHGGFVHSGVLWSPNGLQTTGFTLKLLLGSGIYRYRAGAIDVEGRQILTAVMPGWRFKRNRLEITVFAGLDVQTHATVPLDRGNRLRGANVGARGGIDLWYDTGTLMATTSVSTSTIGPGYWGRAATGWRIFDAAWVGPEVQALGDSTYRQVRAGVHVTSLRTGIVEWSAALGYVRDSESRSSAYGSLGILARR